jgi:hypothetical protein
MNYSTNSKLLQETKEEDTDFTFTIDESKYFYNIFDSQKGICKLYPKFELQYAASVNKFINFIIYKQMKLEDIKQIVKILKFPNSGYNFTKEELLHYMSIEIQQSFKYNKPSDWSLVWVEKFLCVGADPNLVLLDSEYNSFTVLINRFKQSEIQEFKKWINLLMKFNLKLNSTFKKRTAYDYAIYVNKLEFAKFMKQNYRATPEYVLSERSIYPSIQCLYDN